MGFVPPVLNRWCQRLLFPATAIPLLLPEGGCWRCRTLEVLVGKGRMEGERFKMIHVSVGYGMYNRVIGNRHRSSSRLAMEGLFLPKQKFSQRLPELLGMFPHSVALP